MEHAYTPAELSFTTLKGTAAGMASVLVNAAAEADCEVHLTFMTIEESGSAEHTGYHGRRRGARDEDKDEFEIVDSELSLSEWRHPDGEASGLGGLSFDESELCPPDAFEDPTPDEQHFHEATGNERASFERSYRRAGLVLWPRTRRLVVLNQAGLGTAPPYLEDLAKRGADELSGHMLASWPSWRGDEDAETRRMLAVQTRLRNAPRIETFLTERSAEGLCARRDNEAIVDAVALLSPNRATDLLVRIVSHNAFAHLGACTDLLLRYSTAARDARVDQHRV